ncbi:MAG TPA: hypothetical protein VFX92_10385 [Candidatus Krumholzibacteria bacterium]|nr:hypothetical protein [Candidatus Krumholzibacteria bacterium]
MMMLTRVRTPAVRAGLFFGLFCAFILAVGSCGDDNPAAPTDPAPTDLGAMPAVPKPSSLTSEAQSETVTVVKPLKVAFAPRVYDARSNWQLRKQSCTEEFFIEDCGGWSATDYPDVWLSSLPEQSGHRPGPFKVQLQAENGELIQPGDFSYRKNSLNHRRCGFLDCCLCWYNAIWSAPMPGLSGRPYLCRDRYWELAGKSQILPQGFGQEITTKIVQGVEKTECDEWAISVSVEGEVQNGYGSLKTAVEASYSKSVTKTVFEETSVETKYTPERVPDGKQAVYQVWILVDRYTITDKNGRPFADPNYRFGACKRVHIQGVWEAHAVTYFPATSVADEQAAN